MKIHIDFHVNVCMNFHINVRMKILKNFKLYVNSNVKVNINFHVDIDVDINVDKHIYLVHLNVQMNILVNTSLAAKGALAHRLQRRTACKIQNGRQWALKWQMRSGKVSTLRFLGILSNFR